MNANKEIATNTTTTNGAGDYVSSAVVHCPLCHKMMMTYMDLQVSGPCLCLSFSIFIQFAMNEKSQQVVLWIIYFFCLFFKLFVCYCDKQLPPPPPLTIGNGNNFLQPLGRQSFQSSWGKGTLSSSLGGSCVLLYCLFLFTFPGNTILL